MFALFVFSKFNIFTKINTLPYMTKENSVLMKMGRESLKGNWGLAIGAFLVVYLISGAIQSIHEGGGSILYLIIAGPFTLGMAKFSLAYSRHQEPRFEQVFEGFQQFGRTLGAYLLIVLYVFLWLLLLIVPGIIAALAYSMTFFIMTDDVSVKTADALKKSKQMMVGYKWKLFGLYLRFFGWALLCILTLGIGFLWLTPWMHVTFAHFYDDIKDNPATVVKTV